jgi:Subtilisin-like serine proteases
MRKRLILFMVEFVWVSLCFGQNQPNGQMFCEGYSAPSAIFMLRLQQMQHNYKSISKADTALFNTYDLREFNGQWYIGSFITIDASFNDRDIEVFGAKINTYNGYVLTGYIPVSNLAIMRKVKGVRYIEVGTKAHVNLDNARNAIKVGMLHSGYNLPRSFRGDSVIVASIDIGLDFTCPNFFTSGTSNTRIKKVWDQNSSSGTAPTGFTYGRELTSQAAIFAAQTDNVNQYHASHVVGIEAGNGGNDTTYKGVAPQADIYFVGTTMYTNTIADGIGYLFSKAQQEGKPCVINMSLGGSVGPRDGSSSFDRYCDNQVGAGKILVGSAGNEGGDKLHIGHSFTVMDSICTFCKFSNATNTTQNNGSSQVDIWADSSSNMQVAVYLYNTQTNQVVSQTAYVSSNSNGSYSFTLTGSNNNDCSVYIYGGVSSTNNKQNIYISVDNSANTNNYDYVMIRLKSSNNHVNLWIGSAEFTSLSKSFAQDGDTTQTISEIGGTGNSIITVGSYMTKKNWISFSGGSWQYSSGVLNNISPFSSVGPTSDGRTKPDIVAPGQGIVSTFNSFNSSYTTTNSITIDTINGASKTWLFILLQGTSMAAPMISGIVALLLQKYPQLTPSQAKQLLTSTAIQDSFTGNISTNGSNTWGWGKANAYAAMTSLIAALPPKPIVTPNGVTTLCYKDSLYAPIGYAYYRWNNGDTTRCIAVTNSGYYKVKVVNANGYESIYSDSIYINVMPNISINQSYSICQGQTYSFAGQTLTTAGIYRDTLQSEGGCDSVITLVLSVNTTYRDTLYFEATKTIDTMLLGIDTLQSVSGCDSIIVCLGVNGDGLSSAVAQQFNVIVYPNPAKNIIKLSVEGLQERADVIIYDIVGREVKRYNLAKGKETLNIDVSHFAKGTYDVRIITPNRSVSKKIVVE